MYHDKGIYLTQYEGIMERQYTYSHSRAVWDATTDEVVQRTNYYPSGMPMAQSTGQSVQPLKYNAHEYIEAHGYDVYDYGFRGYYATIGRFTSIDPLCERTPWQSPYAYANNNWINQIDILGLAGSDAYTTQDPAKISKLLDFLADGGSLNSFDFDEEGWEECFVGRWWIQNEDLYYVLATMMGDISGGNGLYQLPELTTTLMHTKMTSPNATTNLKDIRDGYKEYGWISTISDIVGWGSAITGVAGNATCNELYWIGKNGKIYTANQRLKGAKGSYVYNRSYELAKGRTALLRNIAKKCTYISIGMDLIALYNNPCPDVWMNLGIDISSALIPGVGWMVSIVYSGANEYVIYKTGSGIGQHIYDFIK
ncbi:MAG: RHS repeat-associated core domain-containing protein [Paludibacteraceae bacterium]|nr:RHS repeat-associated core domain-containing protein [Paludibacteraceae bacterium]